ncbi:MAG: hypothetical protein LBU84_06455 [Prevotella sp.]|jgi:hypothetical protein|nr:hypothetical protein [Prevotella sp.]
MDQNNIAEFLSKVDNIIKSLDELSGLSDNCIKEFDGTEFDGQSQLAGKLDDLFLIASHETATQLAFIKEDILTLIKFIKFRKGYPQLSETELEQILDTENLELKFKMEIKPKLRDHSILEIKKLWNNTFNNKSFKKIISRFK